MAEERIVIVPKEELASVKEPSWRSLLMDAIIEGRRCGEDAMADETYEEQQRRALGDEQYVWATLGMRRVTDVWCPVFMTWDANRSPYRKRIDGCGDTTTLARLTNDRL